MEFGKLEAQACLKLGSKGCGPGNRSEGDREAAHHAMAEERGLLDGGIDDRRLVGLVGNDHAPGRSERVEPEHREVLTEGDPEHLRVVFGAGGDRDRTKRARMGRVAAQYADMAVITSDNPRTEAPMAIIRAIEVGFREIGRVSQYHVIEDRARAIHEAIGLAQAGDVVLIAGKGHETYQIVGDKRLSFDDRQAVTQALRDFGYTPPSTAPH